MTDEIIIHRLRLKAEDIAMHFFGGLENFESVSIRPIQTYGANIDLIEIDVVNPEWKEEEQEKEKDEVVAQPETERMVSDERKAELDAEVDPVDENPSADDMVASGASDAQDDDHDAGTVTEENDPARDEEASGEGSIGKRFFYNADDDKLIVTEDGSVPPVMEDPETAGDWSELDANEGEEIEAELSKQGDLLGGGEPDHTEKRLQGAKEEQQEEKGRKEPEKDATPKGGKLAQRAGIICGEKAFWKHLEEVYETTVTSAEQAAEVVRRCCGVESRSELDTNKPAGHEFRQMDKAYAAWLNA